MIFAINSIHAQRITLKDSTNKAFNVYNLKQSTLPKVTLSTIPVIPANFYSTNLGFFCKKELKIEAVTKIPFKFRLGSVQYVDYMEGKPNANFPR